MPPQASPATLPVSMAAVASSAATAAETTTLWIAWPGSKCGSSPSLASRLASAEEATDECSPTAASTFCSTLTRSDRAEAVSWTALRAGKICCSASAWRRAAASACCRRPAQFSWHCASAARQLSVRALAAAAPNGGVWRSPAPAAQRRQLRGGHGQRRVADVLAASPGLAVLAARTA